MNKNKIWKSIGSLMAIAAPLATVISCGTTVMPTRTTIENKFLLESKGVLDRVQEKWWSMVLSNGGTAINPDDFFAAPLIVESFDFILRNHLTSDANYLTTLANNLMKTKAMQEAAKADGGKSPLQLASSWNILTPRENGDLRTNPVPAAGKKFIFENSPALKEEVIKHAISVKYLSTKINSTDYKKVFLDADQSLTNIQTLIDSDDFVLINEAIEQHLFAKWNISLDRDGSAHFIGENNLTTIDQANSNMNVESPTAGSVASYANYSTSRKLLLDGIMPTTGLNIYGGFKGITASKGSHGLYALDIDGLKTAVAKVMWSGYEYDGKLLYVDTTNHTPGTLIEKLPLFGKNQNHVSLTKLIGLMPIYDGSHFTLSGTDFQSPTGRKQLVMELALGNKVYSHAEKFYIKRPGATGPIILDIPSDILRKITIEHGFEFIKEK